MINRDLFYDKVHPTALQKLGYDALLNEWEAQGFTDLRQLAYIISTVKHETGNTFTPIKEYGSEKYLKAKKYYPYYGRDFTQTTWLENYKKVKEFSGIDVVTYPDKIAEINLAAKVAITFMVKGWYTGKKLAHYINDKKCDYLNARRVINGTDKAKEISQYAMEYEQIFTLMQL